MVPRPDQRVARLGWLFEGEFTVEAPGPNRVAADEMTAHLWSLQRLEPIDAAQVAAFVMLAEAVDSDPTNASLWGQYRAAELQLRQVGTDGDGDDFERLMADLQAPVSDSEVVESAVSGRVRGEDRPGAGVSADALADARRRRGRGDVG